MATGTKAVPSGGAEAIAWGRQFITNPDKIIFNCR